MNNTEWTKSEKKAARRALEIAYERETGAIGDEVRARAACIKEPGDIWDLCDFLNQKRKSIDNKYDSRCSMLTCTLARLVREGWLKHEDLNGLSEEKRAQIEIFLSL